MKEEWRKVDAGVWSWQMAVGTGLGHSQWEGRAGDGTEGEKRWEAGGRGERTGSGWPRTMEDTGLWGELGSLGARGLGCPGPWGWAGPVGE